MQLRIRDGDEKAFTELFHTYQPRIYTFIRRISGMETLAQEIVQDTFLKIWLKRDTLGELQNIGGWIHTIASHLAYNALTRENANDRLLNRLQLIAEARSPETFTPTERLLLEKEYADLLSKAVQKLPERQLIAYRLIKEQGLTRTQAAAEMGISPESVKTNLALALQKIRAYCIARLGPLGLLLFLWASR
ncbi:MAG: sigma-70 family RNA polymerase sigma factor [Candidatus Pseudobacter hemicellulosilyticus]|uniref:Sigma-70 family RNA polymerase sigma factor n=1 Tax=Candidatus Pseudobacter hemicellulosilyticus TaxID=3121375 RepID=A0AAJ6BGQ6_9BACT|nr:MAG: sigma-70 family RNA polymerase sigma factor [Pseudobacter sp.]